jgi:hypothetical protein
LVVRGRLRIGHSDVADVAEPQLLRGPHSGRGDGIQARLDSGLELCANARQLLVMLATRLGGSNGLVLASDEFGRRLFVEASGDLRVDGFRIDLNQSTVGADENRFAVNNFSHRCAPYTVARHR